MRPSSFDAETRGFIGQLNLSNHACIKSSERIYQVNNQPIMAFFDFFTQLMKSSQGGRRRVDPRAVDGQLLKRQKPTQLSR